MFSNTGASMNITGCRFLQRRKRRTIRYAGANFKNWHDPGNNFYHFYSQPVFKGVVGTDYGIDRCVVTMGRDRHAASHAQLSLIGYYSAGGHWDESALGCWEKVLPMTQMRPSVVRW